MRPIVTLIRPLYAAAIITAMMSGTTRAQSVDPTRPAGEPYELPDGRMVFTTWYFVRPGYFEWLDQTGKDVYADKTAKLAPGEARFSPSDTPMGVELFVEPAKREIPAVATDKPWDRNGIHFATLLVENGVYRLWGSCVSQDDQDNDCYFESSDGIAWAKPSLGLVEFDGSTHNNLLPKVIKRLSVFRDPVAPPAERYKSIAYEKKTLWGAVSADGLRWTKLPTPLATGEFDTQNIVTYDPVTRRYVFYVRTHMVGPRAAGQKQPRGRWSTHIKRRAIGIMESDTFGNLPHPDVLLEPTPSMGPADEFYTSCFTSIPRIPDQRLMFPAIYSEMTDKTRIDAYASYNGRNWHRLPGAPIFDTQALGGPDGGCVFASPNLVQRPNGDWILPYNGYDVPHKYPRGSWHFAPGFLVWPKGRLVGIKAAGMGEFSTIAVVAPGTVLKVNAVIDLAGYLEIEVVGRDGKPVPGRSFADAIALSGDKYRTTVRWKNADTLGVRKGDPVFLRFRMKLAKLYGLEFE